MLYHVDPCEDIVAAEQAAFDTPRPGALRPEHPDRELGERGDELIQFAYTVTHDLKAPLLTILGWSAMAQEALAQQDSAAAQDALARVQRAGEQMSRTIEHVLRLSRSGRTIEQHEHVDLDELVQNLTDAYGPALRGSRSEVTAQTPLGQILGDRQRIHALLENLLTNAMKYAPGKIEIGRVEAEGWVRIFVRDFGPGIPPEQQMAIFRLFHRLHTADTSGDGVGLALVQRIMAAHGGCVYVESAVGQGATFWLEFPKF